MIRGAVTKLDPATCRPPPGRLAVHATECAYLIGSIRGQGQLHPAIVRPTKPGDTHPYEIICGVRRHAAIAYLRQNADPQPNRIFLVHIRPLSDEEAFILADQDNRQRRDIPDYQRAQDYAAALETHFRGHQAKMAERLQLAPATLSRLLSLAAMPEHICEAFGGRAHLTITHAAGLAPLLNHPQKAKPLLEAAAKLAKLQFVRRVGGAAHLPAPTVLHRLLAAANPPPPKPAIHKVRDKTGAILATGHRRPNGHITMEITAPDASREAETLAALARILAFLVGSGTSSTMEHVASG